MLVSRHLSKAPSRFTWSSSKNVYDHVDDSSSDILATGRRTSWHRPDNEQRTQEQHQRHYNRKSTRSPRGGDVVLGGGGGMGRIERLVGREHAATVSARMQPWGHSPSGPPPQIASTSSQYTTEHAGPCFILSPTSVDTYKVTRSSALFTCPQGELTAPSPQI